MQSGPLNSGPAGRNPALFATTHWTVVLSAGLDTSTMANEALGTLCQAYWYPLYAYVRRRGYDPANARDLTQEFFAQLLRKRLLASVDPAKGRFRSWLLGVMNHFLAHEWTKATAQKRSPGQPILSWDELDAEERYALEPAEEAAPELIFDRRWAFTVLAHAAARLREEYGSADNQRLFDCLKVFISREGTAPGYEIVAQQLDLTVSGVKSAVHRLRQRYQELIRAEIAQTVATDAEVDDEIRYLRTVIRGH